MKKFLHHFFIPSERNNHRAKLLHHTSLLLFLTLFVFSSIVLRIVKKASPDILGISYSITTSQILDYTNQKRAEKGLSPLKLSDQLTWAAQQKATDMFLKNYWAHYAPDGTTPWHFIKSAGYSYVYAGENLAKGFTNSSDVVDAWMNSPSHRENMLSDKYGDIGFAVVEGKLLGEETVLVVEIFGATQIPQIAQAEPNIQEVQVKEVALFPKSENTAKAAINEVKSQTSTPVFAEVIRRPLVNLMSIPKTITITIFALFVLALFLDLLIIERKKIPRIVGHNLDHIMLLAFFILYIVLVSTGSVF